MFYLFNDALNTFYLWLYGISQTLKSNIKQTNVPKEVNFISYKNTMF